MEDQLTAEAGKSTNVGDIIWTLRGEESTPMRFVDRKTTFSMGRIKVGHQLLILFGKGSSIRALFGRKCSRTEFYETYELKQRHGDTGGV